MKNPKKIVTFNTSYCERSNMNKENKIRKILKDSNLDGTKASMCVEIQELDEEIVQNCLTKELYDERTVLYEKYADICVSEEGMGIEETVQKLGEMI